VQLEGKPTPRERFRVAFTTPGVTFLPDEKQQMEACIAASERLNSELKAILAAAQGTTRVSQ
jgi:hypothetical protein